MSNILDKVINIAVIGGIGLLAYEYFQCKAKNKEFISCLFGDLGKVGGDFTGGMIDNRINFCSIYGRSLFIEFIDNIINNFILNHHYTFLTLFI